MVPEQGEHIGDATVYSLDGLRRDFDVRDLGPGWLVLNHEKSGGNWLRFAVCEFRQSATDGSRTLVSVVFYGEGPGGKDDPLRECRHTYWGEDGYLFYPNGVVIAAALQALSEFFDEMAPATSATAPPDSAGT